MPQLDRFAFISQVVWLVVLFFGMYILLLKEGLPRFYKVLRFRKEKIVLIAQSASECEKEVYLVEGGIKSLLTNGVGIIRELSEKVVKVWESNLEGLGEEKRAKMVKLTERVSLKRKEEIVEDINLCTLLGTSGYVRERGENILKRKI